MGADSYLLWNLSEAAATEQWRLDFTAESSDEVEISISSPPSTTPRETQVSANVATFGAPQSTKVESAEPENDDEVLQQFLVSGSKQFQSNNLDFTAGKYLIRLHSTTAATQYQLQLSNVEEPPPSIEVLTARTEQLLPGDENEPNDAERTATLLAVGDTATGSFSHAKDSDYFQFSVFGDTRIKFELTPPEDVQMSLSLSRQSLDNIVTITSSTERSFTQELAGGDYILRLRGDLTSDELYKVKLTALPTWPLADETIPSRTKAEAMLLPASGLITAYMGGAPRQPGWYRLPISAQERTLNWKGNVHKNGYAHYTGLRFVTASEQELPGKDYGLSHGSVVIPANEQIYVHLTYGGRSSPVQISDPAEQINSEPFLVATLNSEINEFAAYSQKWQKIELQLLLVNEASTPQDVRLVSHSSHREVEFVGLPEQINLAAGAQSEIAFSVHIPPERVHGAPIDLFVGDKATGATAHVALQPTLTSSEIGPFDDVGSMSDVTGLTNLAWHALGAEFVSDKDTWAALHDGFVSSGTGAKSSIKPGEATPALRLAGGGGRIHALEFNTRSDIGEGNLWREVEVLLGPSAEELTSAFTLELTSPPGPQLHKLAVPREAAYVAFRPLKLWAGRWLGSHGLGEIKVLGEPASELAATKHNILAWDLGGHWLYTLPESQRLYGLEGQMYGINKTLTADSASEGEPLRDRTFDMVFGFREQRTAAIGELQWQEDLTWQGQPLESVKVFYSDVSPLGPWQPLGEWKLERDEHGLAKWPLANAILAKYLRFNITEPAQQPDAEAGRWRIPQSIAAIEAGGLGAGQSILSYSGSAAKASAESAATLSAGAGLKTHRFSGPGDELRVPIRVAPEENSIRLFLQESQPGRLNTALTNANGETIPLDWQTTTSGRDATVPNLDAGEYSLRLTEPPRSIVVVWDGSASVSHHQATVYQALQGLAEGLEPGREVVNLMPMGGPLLIDGWAESPQQVAQVLAAYDGRFNSSGVERALHKATKALAEQSGEKAILLVTDAAQGNRDLRVWRAFEEVKPRVFTIQLPASSYESTASRRWHQEQMMTWAAINNGSYRYVATRTELTRALFAAMQQLRGGTRFAVEHDSFYAEVPKPGTLRVISGREPLVAAGVIHLIFDASGSMLQRMDGGRRIDVAKKMVEQVLNEQLPADLPVALRAFGHTRPDSCDTELLVAPANGNQPDVLEAIRAIEAINLARTPLAASLAAVPSDLADIATQKNLIVLLTDGEETCDGDLKTTLMQLNQQNFDIQLNIVGFRIDDDKIENEFMELAALGRGGYFSSSDGEQLSHALTRALAPTWTVKNTVGALVAEGRVGDPPITLPAGHYHLSLASQHGISTQSFSIKPEQNLQLEINQNE